MESQERLPDDALVRRSVWAGAIVIRLVLDAHEVTTLTAPPPLYLMAPRLGYLPLLLDKIRPHFQTFLPPGTDTMWFDFNGLPLKWHMPTGVLYDLLVEDQTLPWRLTVHFRKYPADSLVPIDSEDTIKWNYMNALKEAIYLMQGTTKPVMGLSQKDQSELWRCVAAGDCEGYDKVASLLRPPSQASPSGVATPSGRQRLAPLRLYIRERGGPGCVGVDKWEDVWITTRGGVLTSADGEPTSLRTVLQRLLPQLFGAADVAGSGLSEPSHARRLSGGGAASAASSRRTSEVGDMLAQGLDLDKENHERTYASEGSKSTAGSTGAVEGFSGSVESSEVAEGSSRDEERVKGSEVGGAVEELIPKVRLRVQGIEPKLDVPLQWLVRNLGGSDMFLHVCIIKGP